MMVETADDSAFQEPDNSAAIALMEEAMRSLPPTSIAKMTPEEIAALAPTSDDAGGRQT